MTTAVPGEGWTAGPWRACRAGECQCGMIWSTAVDQQIVTAYGAREHGEFVVAAAHSQWGDGPSMVYGVVPEAEREANASLIAAAPDLYEALKNLVAIYDDEFGMVGPEMAAARTALAKASPASSEADPR